MGFIEGRVHNSAPGEQIVLYARNKQWWVQPTTSQPFTALQPDSSQPASSWRAATHLGDKYAALLVRPGYHPESRLAALPEPGRGVVAVTVKSGHEGLPVAPKQVHFSGYDWSVQAAPSARGGEINSYDSSNAWVDAKGHLHLRMGLRDGRWTCAEVFLNRSLGYGTYSFVVEDSASLEPWAVEGLYLVDDDRADTTRKELDVELGKWGNTHGANAQYVVQPYYVAQNMYHTRVPIGTLVHTLRWEPGSAAFSTRRALREVAAGTPIRQHVFTSGIPRDSGEIVHVDLYDFYHSLHPSTAPVEVVIDRFEYLP